MFDHILNWKLLRGNHEFPGPDGGTCINEAAIIAAGFPYKEVRSAEDCPPCFSRVVATYAIRINDAMPDDERQKFLPFVTRLSGSADSPAVERQRAEYIALRTIRDLLPLVLRLANLRKEADACAAAETLRDAKRAAARATCAAWTEQALPTLRATLEAARAAEAEWVPPWAVAEAARAAAAAATEGAKAARPAETNIWALAVSILEGALQIGNQAPAIDVGLVAHRLERAKMAA